MNDEMMIGIHLDLKYQMPNKAYLHDWLRDLARCGINTLLLEYEDKFPFRTYPFLRDPQAFTESELMRFLDVARSAGLQVIPLVQTLSHLEFALAHDELAALRERADIPTQICPSNPQALAFVKTLIEEVLAYHQDDAFFHLGADEAWSLGTCDTCKAWREKDGVVGVWSQHERQFTQLIVDAGKTPMIWDDVFWAEPESIAGAALPPQTVLASWQYAITRCDDSNGRRPLGRVDTYQQHGYRTVAAPCLNWGVLAPQRSHCLDNTRAWAQKLRTAKMSGMINTAWASFHVPLPMALLEVAATAALCRGEIVDDAWEAAFWQQTFGIDVPRMSAAAEMLGQLWEVPVPGLNRPLTPAPYGYMDMVLHYQAGPEERMRRGAYPLDWAEVDFDDLYQRKIELLRQASAEQNLVEQAQGFLERYRAVGEILSPLNRATRNQPTAQLWRLLAELKRLTTEVYLHHLTGAGEVAGLRSGLLDLESRLAAGLQPFLEAPSVDRMLRIWLRPQLTSLGN